MLFKCPHCEIKLRNKNAYVGHLNDVHFLGKNKKLPCPICNISFNGKTSFYKHFINHAESLAEDKSSLDKSEEILCRHCRIFFPSMEVLEKHFKSLTSPIYCPRCDSKPSPNFKAYRVHKHRYVKWNLNICRQVFWQTFNFLILLQLLFLCTQNNS